MVDGLQLAAAQKVIGAAVGFTIRNIILIVVAFAVLRSFGRR